MKKAHPKDGEVRSPHKPRSSKEDTVPRFRLDEERVAEILDVATDIFTTVGFAAASTNEIAKRANASKGTFYSRFPSKEQLFIAVMERRLETVAAAMTGRLPQDPDTKTTLLTFGTHMLNEVLSKERMSLIRTISMESGRFPALGVRYYQAGPRKGQLALAQYMKGQIGLGRLTKSDPMRMAEHLISLLMGGQVRWSGLGMLPKPIGRKELRDHLLDAVEAFLRAYGAKET